MMPRRLPGLLLLIFLALGLLYTRPAWAESNGEEPGNVLVRVSPLTLLLENDVTIKVGEFTCQLVNGADPSSVCSDLPPGEYEVSASSEGYIVSPPSYQLRIPGDPEDSEDDEDSDNEDGDDEDDEDSSHSPDAVTVNSEFYFELYQINNQLYMPNVQVE